MATQNSGSVLGNLGKKVGAQDAPDTDNKALGAESTEGTGLIAENGDRVFSTDPDAANNQPNGDPQPTAANLDQGIVGAAGNASSIDGPKDDDGNRSTEIVDTIPVKSTSTRRGPRTEAEAVKEESGEGDVEVAKPVAAYKHRQVRHFKVGNFEFKNHLLYIYTDKANDEFLNYYDALEPRDQNAIVQYDWEAAERVEQPVAASRGAMSTSSIKDAKAVRG